MLEVTGKGYRIENADKLNNGDGLYFVNENGEADGLQVNTVENGIVYPNVLKFIPTGTLISRNSDAAFNKLVEREDSAIRKISVEMLLQETLTGFKLTVQDEDGCVSIAEMEFAKDLTKNNESIIPNIKTNLGKTGNTPFIANKIEVEFLSNWFLPISKINDLRRMALEKLIRIRVESYHVEEFQITKTNHPYPVQKLDFMYNVSNKMARKFYERHGVTEIEKAFELQWDPGKARVMTTKYCVKYELGKCPKFQRDTMGTKLVEPLTLKHGENEYKLKFNCKPCEMEIWEKDAELEFEED